MYKSLRLLQKQSDRAGAMLPLIAVVIVILFVACVLAVDIARIHVTRSELRTATDAAARAGVEALGRKQSESAGLKAALKIAKLNIVAGNGLDLDPEQVQFGTSVENADGSVSFVTDQAIVNSIRVVGARTAGSPDGPVNMMFGKLFGQASFEPVQTAAAMRLDRDIALVLDESGSMGNFGRFDALLDGVEVFLDELDSTSQLENVSLITYSTNATKLVDLTTDLDLIQSELDKRGPLSMTAIGLGLDMGLDSILNDANARPFALKSIVLMTDGNHNTGINPKVIAEDCAAAGITVHTITFSEGADEVLMKEVAEITGGTHLHAKSKKQLKEAFKTIAKQIQVLLFE